MPIKILLRGEWQVPDWVDAEVAVSRHWEDKANLPAFYRIIADLISSGI